MEQTESKFHDQDLQPASPKRSIVNRLTLIYLLFALLVLYTYLPEIVAGSPMGMACAIVSSLFLAFLAYCCSVIDRQNRARKNRLRELPDLSRRKAEESLTAQMNKPEFLTRLARFTGQDSTKTHPSSVDSSCQYWEADDLEIRMTKARSIEYLRVFLNRIANLFR